MENKNIALEPLRIEGTKDTPTVIFDTVANHFEISGRSFPLNTKGFYIPVVEWFEKYAETYGRYWRYHQLDKPG